MPAPAPSPQPGDPTPPTGEPPQDATPAPELDASTPVRGVPAVPVPGAAAPAEPAAPQVPAAPAGPAAPAAPAAPPMQPSVQQPVQGYPQPGAAPAPAPGQPAASPYAPAAPGAPGAPGAPAASGAPAQPAAYPAPGQAAAYPQPVQPGQPVQPPQPPAGGYPAPVQMSGQTAPTAYPAPGQTFPGAPTGTAPAQPAQPVWAGGAPAGVAPTTPKIPVPFPALLAAAARRAGAGYLAALVLAFVQTVLLIGFTDELSVGAVASMPVLLVSMALLGSASVSYTGSTDFFDSSFGATLHLVPLTLLLALLVGVVVVATLERRTNQLPAVEGALPRDRWITAALTGGVLTVGASVLAAVLRLTVPGEQVRIGAFGFALVLGAFVVGALASVLADVLGARGSVHPHRIGLRIRPTGEVRAALSAFTTLLGLPAVVLLVIGLVWTAIESPESLLGVPALVLNVLVWAVAIVMGGGISMAGASSYGDTGAEVQTLFGSGAPVWAILLLLLLALLATLVSGAVLAIRRPGAPWARAWVTPLVFAVGGGLLTLLSGVVLSGGLSLGSFGGSASGWVGIAPWWFLSLAVWALGVEAVARYVAPFLVGVLPVGLQQSLARRAAATGAAGGVGTPAVDGSTGTVPAQPAVPGAVPTQPALPVAAPLSPTARRWVLIGGIGLGALVVLGVGGSIAVDQINQRVFGPEAVAQDYLDALEAGKASEALELGSIDTLDMDEALLTDEVYAAATDRPTDARVVDVTRSGDSAVLTVEYQQGGATVSQTLFARRTGSTAVLFDAWQLRDNSVGTISLAGSSDTEALTVNGVEVDLADGWMLAALPGTYTITGAESRWIESSETSVTVRGTDWADAEAPEARPSAELEAEAERLVSEYLDTCIASTEAEPEDCPNQSWTYYDLAGLTWTLDSAPTIELDLDSSWTEGEYVIDTVREGSATLTGTYAEETWSHAAGEPYSETVDLSLSGTIIVDGDDVRYEYSRY